VGTRIGVETIGRGSRFRALGDLGVNKKVDSGKESHESHVSIDTNTQQADNSTQKGMIYHKIKG